MRFQELLLPPPHSPTKKLQITPPQKSVWTCWQDELSVPLITFSLSSILLLVRLFTTQPCDVLDNQDGTRSSTNMYFLSAVVVVVVVPVPRGPPHSHISSNNTLLSRNDIRECGGWDGMDGRLFIFLTVVRDRVVA